MERFALDTLSKLLHNDSEMEGKNNMVTVTIKSIPEEIYEKIRLRAKRNHRSLSAEIISIFEHALQKRTPMDVKEILERARQTRELTANYTVTADEIERMINNGRE
jgi:plasmid stability protein